MENATLVFCKWIPILSANKVKHFFTSYLYGSLSFINSWYKYLLIVTSPDLPTCNHIFPAHAAELLYPPNFPLEYYIICILFIYILYPKLNVNYVKAKILSSDVSSNT